MEYAVAYAMSFTSVVATRAYGAGRPLNMFLHHVVVRLSTQWRRVVSLMAWSCLSSLVFTACVNITFILLQKMDSARSWPSDATSVSFLFLVLCLHAFRNMNISFKAAPCGRSLTRVFLFLWSNPVYSAKLLSAFVLSFVLPMR